MLRRLVACLAVGAFVGCGGGDDDQPQAAKRAVPEPTSTPTDTRPDSVIAPDALLGIVTAWDGNSGTLVAPVNERTLEPGAPWAEFGEYHDTWSVSPDRRMAAFGISAPGQRGRIGIRILDLGTLRTVKDHEVGIAAEAVGWIAPDRLVAFLQSGEVVVLDPLSGEEIAREALGGISCPWPPSAVTELGFVLVVADGGAARIVLADERGRVQSVRLPRIGAGVARGVCQHVGLAVDPQRQVAYVIGAQAPIAEVHLRTMRVRHHRLTGAPRLLTLRGCRACSADVSALWLGRGRLAVVGIRHPPSGPSRTRGRPAGAAVVDTRDWTARTIAPRAGRAVLAGGRLLAFDGRHPAMRPRGGTGLRVHDRSGALRHALLAAQTVGDVQVAGARAYVRATRGLHVVDLRRGRVIARFPGRRRDVQLLLPR